MRSDAVNRAGGGAAAPRPEQPTDQALKVKCAAAPARARRTCWYWDLREVWMKSPSWNAAALRAASSGRSRPSSSSGAGEGRGAPAARGRSAAAPGSLNRCC
jgi:hypothetical protein